MSRNYITKWIELKSTFDGRKIYLVSQHLWDTLKNSHSNKGVKLVDSFFKVCFVFWSTDKIETLIPAHSVHFEIFVIWSNLNMKGMFLAIHDWRLFSCSWFIIFQISSFWLLMQQNSIHIKFETCIFFSFSYLIIVQLRMIEVFSVVA